MPDIDHYCSCIDWPCCGHGSGAAGGGLDPENAEEWLEGLEEGEREFAENYMVPCRNCGEMRPRNDPSIQEDGICYMCHGDPERRNSEAASRNLTYFREREQRLADERDTLLSKVDELEKEVRRLRAQLQRRSSDA